LIIVKLNFQSVFSQLLPNNQTVAAFAGIKYLHHYTKWSQELFCGPEANWNRMACFHRTKFFLYPNCLLGRLHSTANSWTLPEYQKNTSWKRL